MKRTNVSVLTVAVAMTLVLAGYVTAQETQMGATTTMTSAGGCTDSDGGKVFDVKGVTNGQNGKKVDTCVDPTRLREYYCDGGLAQNDLVLCKRGCVDGTCRGPDGTIITALTATKSPTPLGAITGVTGSTTQAQTSATSTTMAQAATTTTIAAQSIGACSDSDGGRNPNVKGTMTLIGIQYTDACVTSLKLREWYCSSAGTVNSELYRCKNGCSMGACKPARGTVAAAAVTTISTATTIVTVNVSTSSATTTVAQTGAAHCVDSDGGKVYDKKGTTNGGNGVKTDNCQDPVRLREYYCDGGLVKEELKVCEKGCNSGRCR